MRRSNRNFNIPLPGKARAFELFKIGSFKFPPPRAKMVFKCPTLSSHFVCQMPLLKKNHRRFLSSVIKLVYIRGTQRYQLKRESYFRRWIRGSRNTLRTRNTYWLVSQLRRMLFEWLGILQFINQSGFSFDSVFFFLSLLTAVLSPF